MLLYKNYFYEVGGFCEEIFSLEDYEFALRFSNKYHIAYIDEVLLNVYKQQNGVNSRVDHYIFAMIYIINKWKKEMKEYNILNTVVEELLMIAEKYGYVELIAEKLKNVLLEN